MNSIYLLWKLLIISLKKEYVYRFEMVMTFIQLAFSLGFTIIFWYTLFQYIPALNNWRYEELLFYSTIVFLGEGVAGFFFGFRDMPDRIIHGELDKYLVKPVNPVIALLFENVSAFYFLEQLIVAFIMVYFIVFKYKIRIKVEYLIPALFIMIIGVVIIQLMIGILTFMAFWYGRIENLRNLFMSILDIKEYPLSIFPKSIRSTFTYIIPISFVAYYPSSLLIGKEKFHINILYFETIFFVLILLVFLVVWRAGLKRYEANGG